MEISRYPDLSLVKEEVPSPCQSPVLPMLPPPDGKGKHGKSRFYSDSLTLLQMFMNAPILLYRFSNETASY